jgi:hypothetical protein
MSRKKSGGNRPDKKSPRLPPLPPALPSAVFPVAASHHGLVTILSAQAIVEQIVSNVNQFMEIAEQFRKRLLQSNTYLYSISQLGAPIGPCLPGKDRKGSSSSSTLCAQQAARP